nr:AAA family ATPase [Lacticaseibacillus manihotivorans]
MQDKSFEEFGKLTFDFPVTVIVGKNGSGKSSILHALYGCPKGNSPAKYWFSSATDPIKDENDKNMAQCFVYTYHNGANQGQVAMKRSSRPGTAHRRKDPDYWETEKPRKMYKMQSMVRSSPIVWDNLYIDFRQELSAYDKFFYFGNIDGLKSVTKNDYVRREAPTLKKVLNTPNKIYTRGSKAQNKECVDLTPKELHFISSILGVKYVSGKLVDHRFYRGWGTTALVKKHDLTYTEAHAGSGEFAVIKLVHQLCSLKKDESRLILLDEPETSLYPGAQKRLLEFILTIVKFTKSQVVISTHSEKFISCLPDRAIKAIKYDDNVNNTLLLNECSPSTVFGELEVPLSDKCVVYVEDNASEILLRSVVKSELNLQDLVIHKLTSGANTMMNRNVLTSSERIIWDDYYFLDGDQKPTKLVDVDTLTASQLEDEKLIDNLCQKISSSIKFPSSRSRGDKNQSTDDKARLDSQTKFLKFCKQGVKYLPCATPEDVIWDEDFLRKYISVTGIDVQLEADKKKSVFHKIVATEVDDLKPDSSQYYNFIERLCIHWVKTHQDTIEYKSICQSLKEIQAAYENLHR